MPSNGWTILDCEETWLRAVVGRLKEEVGGNQELEASAIRPLLFILAHSAPESLPAIRPFLTDLLLHAQHDESPLEMAILESVSVILNRLGTGRVKEKVLQLILSSLCPSSSAQLRLLALRSLPSLKDELSGALVGRRVVPSLEKLVGVSGLPVEERLALVEAIAGLADLISLSATLRLLSRLRGLDAASGSALAKLVRRLVSESSVCGISDEDVATICLPLLCPLLAAPHATAIQVLELATVCHECLGLIESHRCAMLKPKDSNSSRGSLASSGGTSVPQIMLTMTSPGDGPSSAASAAAHNLLARPAFPPRRSSDVPFSSAAARPALSDPAAPFLSTPNIAVRRHSYTNVPLPETPKPTSLTNLTHNLACTIWNRFGT